MDRLSIKDIINNAKDELERAYEIISLNDDTKAYAEDSMLLSDIASSLERLEDIQERIDFALLMSACIADVAIPTAYEIYELEAKTELPYKENGLVDTETVYNMLDDIVSELAEQKGR